MGTRELIPRNVANWPCYREYKAWVTFWDRPRNSGGYLLREGRDACFMLRPTCLMLDVACCVLHAIYVYADYSSGARGRGGKVRLKIDLTR